MGLDNNMEGTIRIIVIMFVMLPLLHKSESAEAKTCTYKNGGKTYQINEGDVTEIKKKEEVKAPYKYGCNGCTFNGKIVCQGTVVQDLYRWWFLAVCDKGRMK